MKLPLIFLVAAIIIACSPIRADSQTEKANLQEVIKRAEAIKAEAESLVKMIKLQQGLVGAASLPSSITDIVNGLSDTIKKLNAVLDEAKIFLQTGTTTLQSVNTNINTIRGSINNNINTVGLNINTNLSNLTENIKGNNDKLTNNIIANTDKITNQLTKSTESITNDIHSLTSNIEQNMNNVTNNVNNNTNQMTSKIIDSLTKIDTLLATLNVQIADLIQATTRFINETTASVNDIRRATERTVGFVDSLGGRVYMSYYGGTGGLDSSADLTLWRKTSKDGSQFGYFRFTLDGVDNPSRKEFSVITGTNHGIFNVGAGYIQNGLGLDVGLNQFGERGFDSRLSLYRLRDMGINLEMGYRPRVMKGVRLFVFGEDVLQSDESLFGGGIGYERKF